MRTTATARQRFAQVVVLIAALAALTAGASAADQAALASAAASITTAELQNHVNTLADDTFEGREAGSRGGRAAGNYLLKAFESYELAPAGEDGTYFQAFNSYSRNVLGLLEGSDPALREQVILVGAHYDHVGYGRATNSFGPFGYVHNGADDNASGVAGLLEIVDALKKLPAAPRRSILFALWDAEEQGLIGSRFWVGRPTLPLDRVRLAINLDMIGRMKNGRVEVYGSRTASGLRRLISDANTETAAQLDFNWKMKADSDHWPFFERRISVLMFHTGLHGEYHRPSDDAHLVNHEGLASVARLTLETIVRLADADQPPTFREASLRETQAHRAQLEQPAAPQPPRYGLPYRFEPGDPPKVVVTAVHRGSPAEQAGLLAGDQLLKFQGETIRDEAWFRLALLAAEGETTFHVERAGSEQPLLLKVTPVGEPIRVGITWRMDDAEPSTALVTQVVYGSAAFAAGLETGDRIYSVGGRSFASQDELGTLLGTTPGPIELVAERDGRVRTVTLVVLDPPPAAE